MAIRADDVDLGRDRDLVERFQAGDHEGFEDLYRRYYPRLRRFCAVRLNDPHEAEEVAQEAFVRALGALPRLQGERRFYPWLTVIASRLCVDSQRRQARIEPKSDIDLGVIEGGQQAIVEASDLDLLTQALANLSDRHREVLRLREHEGWSYQRIAAHLGCTQATIETLLFRARRSLRKEFRALSGEGALAGLPVFGWFVRKAQAAVARINTAYGLQLAPMTANAFSAAVVAGSVAVGAIALVDGASTGGNATLAASRNPIHNVRVQRAETAPPVPMLSPVGARNATATRPTPASTTNRVVPGHEEARRRAEDKPVSADAGPATLGIDPSAPQRIVSEIARTAGVNLRGNS